MMIIPPCRIIAAWRAAAALAFLHAGVALALNVDSPDAKIRCTIVPDGSGHLTFAVTLNAQPIVAPSLLGVNVAGQDLGANATLGAATNRVISETYPVAGGHSTAVNSGNESLVPVEGGALGVACSRL